MTLPPEQRDDEELGYASHGTPTFDTVDGVRVIRLPNEDGVFPTANIDTRPLASFSTANVYQMHPRYQGSRRLAKRIASGVLEMRDPAPGTADEVALVCECDEVDFFLKVDDATMRVSSSEFVLALPEDCLLVQLPDAQPSDVLHFEGLLAARTQFHDETCSVDKVLRETVLEPDQIPDDTVGRSLHRTSQWFAKIIVRAGEYGSRKLEHHGHKKRDAITETEEKKVRKSSIAIAKGVRKVSEATSTVAVKVTDKISDSVGHAIAKKTAARTTDSVTKQRARKLLVASSVAYAEVADGVEEAYDIFARTAKDETALFVSKKYGEDYAQLARHTAGAAANFGSAALTVRRVVNVKTIAKASAKKAVMAHVLQK